MDLTSDNGVIFPHVAAIDITSGDLAISFWLKAATTPTVGTTTTVWQKTSSGGANTDINYFYLSGSAPAVFDSNQYSTTVTGPLSVNDDTDFTGTDFTDWVHLCVRKNSSGLSTWVNGVQSGSGAATAVAMLSNPTSFYALFYDPNAAADPLLTCDVRLADFRCYNGISDVNIANLAAKQDVTTNLFARVKFEDNCNDSVGSMNGTKGSNVSYCPGPPGLPA